MDFGLSSEFEDVLVLGSEYFGARFFASSLLSFSPGMRTNSIVAIN
jgi:hypothetical protein